MRQSGSGRGADRPTILSGSQASPTGDWAVGREGRSGALPLTGGTGWREEVQLGIPAWAGRQAIERLVNAMLPHGRDSRAGKGANES